MFRNIKKIAVLTCIALGSSAYCAEDAVKIFNPDPKGDDVILPLPCNRIMAFRKVYTSNDPKKIKDKNYNAGSAQNKSPMSQNPNLRYVQGSFHDSHGYYFLIAKYELMAGQYDALVNSDKCDTLKLNKLSRLPAVKISYFDAMNAAHAYSLFLQQSKDSFKSENNTVAYARLASDDEWEFAARGGNAVTQSQFESNLPPMENDDLSLYAWFDGPMSANGKLQLAGLKKPNPLGIHDMLGNAQEMTLEPFKAVRTGRLLGLSGGICVRGGSYLTPKDSLSSSARTEKPLYINGSDVVANDTSTRFVLSVPVAQNTDEVKKLNSDVESLGDHDDSEDNNVLVSAKQRIEKYEAENRKAQENFKKETDALKEQNSSLNELNSNLEKKSEKLQKLNDSLLSLNDKLNHSNSELLVELKDLKDKITTANAQAESMKEVAVAANLRLGGFLCKTVNDGANTLNYYQNLLKVVKKQCESSKDRCKNLDSVNSNIALNEASLKELLTYYGDTMANARMNYSMGVFKSQLKNAKEAFGSNSRYDTYVDTYYRHLDGYKNLSKDSSKNHKLWTDECSKVGKGQK